MTPEQVALEHIGMRRRQGWSLADCRSEARLCAAMRGLPETTIATWDDVVIAVAMAWEELPRAKMMVAAE